MTGWSRLCEPRPDGLTDALRHVMHSMLMLQSGPVDLLRQKALLHALACMASKNVSSRCLLDAGICAVKPSMPADSSSTIASTISSVAAPPCLLTSAASCCRQQSKSLQPGPALLSGPWHAELQRQARASSLGTGNAAPRDPSAPVTATITAAPSGKVKSLVSAFEPQPGGSASPRLSRSSSRGSRVKAASAPPSRCRSTDDGSSSPVLAAFAPTLSHTLPDMNTSQAKAQDLGMDSGNTPTVRKAARRGSASPQATRQSMAAVAAAALISKQRREQRQRLLGDVDWSFEGDEDSSAIANLAPPVVNQTSKGQVCMARSRADEQPTQLPHDFAHKRQCMQ